MSGPRVELFYDFSSTNAYFAAFLTPEMCRRVGAELIWKPYHLGHVFRQRGHAVLRDHGPEKLEYLFQDHLRWARKTGLAFRRPSIFPIKTSLALRGSIAMREWDREEAYIQAVMRRYWAEDGDIADAEVLADIASSLGVDGAEFLDRANSEATRAVLQETTADGMARKVFGAPMFFVGEEMFWGKDRLDFVEEALQAQLEH